MVPCSGLSFWLLGFAPSFPHCFLRCATLSTLLLAGPLFCPYNDTAYSAWNFITLNFGAASVLNHALLGVVTFITVFCQ